ncbi:hypothetical protein [Pseudoduganella namucuonensis]|nr:hypothetical protein [Pseudoduganella namucuonensis]
MNYAQLTPGERFSPTRAFGYYSQRLVTQPSLRRAIVRTLAGFLRLSGRDTLVIKHHQKQQLNALNENGFVHLGQVLSAGQCEEIRVHMQDKTLTVRANRHRHFTLASIPHDVSMADYQLEDIVNCPHILSLANSPTLLALAANYIGCLPTLSALSLRWSMPSDRASNNLQGFHRDADDWRYLKVLVYLTDVGLGEGPHIYVLKTHKMQGSVKLRAYSDEFVGRQFGSERALIVTGQAGTGFAVDTSGIHKGVVPNETPRLLLQIQYSLLPAYFYEYAPLPYHGPLKLNRHVNRLIVRN